MSLEYFAFSKDASPIPIGRLSANSRNHGMALRILRNFARWNDSQIVLDGDLLSDDVISGWDIKDKSSTVIESAFANQDWAYLEKSANSGSLALCELEIWDNPKAYNANIEDEAHAYGADYLTYRSASSVRFFIRTSSGRSKLAVGLQVFLLQRILELRGGMFEDPQENQYKFISATDSATA